MPCSQCPLWIWNCFTLQVTILHSKSDEWVIPGARQRNSFCLLKGSFCLRLLNCHSSDFCTHTKKRCWGCSTVEPICICQCCLLFVSNGLGVQCFSLFINLDKESLKSLFFLYLTDSISKATFSYRGSMDFVYVRRGGLGKVALVYFFCIYLKYWNSRNQQFTLVDYVSVSVSGSVARMPWMLSDTSMFHAA